MEANPYGIDEEEFGYSLANLIEPLVECLEAAGATSVVEIGAQRGTLTRELLAWAGPRGGRVIAVDPEPEPALLDLSQRHPELELIRERSPRALRELPSADAVILDGDHNHFILTEELETIEQRSPDALPLLFVHDVGWPHGRRDAYHDPDRIPVERRQPLGRDVHLRPGDEGVSGGGLAYKCVAAREGGNGNGVLTAIEDFAATRDWVRFVTVPAFFGLAIVWDRRSPAATPLAAAVDSLDHGPLLERLEANRVEHLVARVRQTELLRTEQERRARLEALLARLLGSRAFAWAERASRLRHRGAALFSREEVRELLRPEAGSRESRRSGSPRTRA